LQLPYYYTEARCDLDILPRTLPEICCGPAPGICCRRAGTAARTDHAVQYCVPGLVQAHPATVRCGPKRLMGSVQQRRYCIFAWAVASVASLSRCSPRREKKREENYWPTKCFHERTSAKRFTGSNGLELYIKKHFSSEGSSCTWLL
jgi:hypothetical protein